MKLKTTALAAFSLSLSHLGAESIGVNTKAANYKTGTLDDYRDYIERSVKAYHPEAAKAFSLDNLMDLIGIPMSTGYAQSSTPQGTEWINASQMNIGNNYNGILALMFQSKHQEQVVSKIAPAGSDVVFQIPLNMAQVEPLILDMVKLFSDEETVQEVKTSMQEAVPGMDMTTEELLAKIDLRLSMVLDLDPTKQLPTPMGTFDTPKLMIRLDGITWIWEKLGPQIIGGSGLPFSLDEQDGVLSYTIPAEMAPQFMGFLPIIVVDKNNDHIWISSTPEFYKACASGKNTLAESTDYLETMDGIPKNGIISSYLSKYSCDYISKMLAAFESSGMFEGADANTQAQLKRATDLLSKVQHGFASTVVTNAQGILTVERHVQNTDQQLLQALSDLKELEALHSQEAEATEETQKAESE
ncbi:hypothetical protein [Rubritalea marina]|uniref:hypothetical protein n=1 Tax=Rubritalea marina TaxID=361055 RepID=UPI00036D4C2D|nr:hypothetical protein [Rubritalea marina]